MGHNPYTESHNKLKAIVEKLNNDMRMLKESLFWYQNTNLEKLSQELQLCPSEIKDRALNLTGIENKIASLTSNLSETESNIKTILNPLNWFSTEQKSYHQKRKVLKTTLDTEKKKQQLEISLLDACKRKCASLEGSIHRYKNFDKDKVAKHLDELATAIVPHQIEFERLYELKRKVDVELSALVPMLAELKTLELKKQAAITSLVMAKDYDDKLSKESTRHGRAIIHAECARKLGDGSPKKITYEQNKILEQIDREHFKLQKRINAIQRKASRIIETIIIDGNNMCYESSDFVGLNPLKKAIAELQKRFEIIVVFDSSIRSKLQSNNDGIAKQFPDDIKVHIVASKHSADVLILDLASGNTRNYIISNDRFGEYKDKEVVMSDRLIRHEIVNNRAFIHDLSVDVLFA